MKLELIPTEPCGSRTMEAFVEFADGPGKLTPVRVLEYPNDGRRDQLFALRRSREITLRDAARRLGIGAAEFSALESGRMTLPDEQWRWLLSGSWINNQGNER